MIKELNELVWYAEKSLWRDEALLAFLCKNKPEMLKLYAAIQKNHFKTDEAAAQGAGFCLTTYKKYGKALKSHLLDMVFFYNEEKARADTRLKTLFEGMKHLGAMRMLYARGCRVASKEVAENLLKKGLVYEWPDFVMQAALYLKECVLRVGGSEKEFEYYAQLYAEYKKWTDLENQAWECVQRAQLPYRKKTSGQRKTAGSLINPIRQLEAFEGKVPSIMFHVYFYLLKNQYYMEENKHAELLKNCNKALAYLRGKSYPVQNLQASFHYVKVVAYTYLHDFESGKLAAEEGLKMAAEGTPSWFSAQEVYLYLCLHTENYEKAIGIYMQVTNHKRFSGMHTAQRELWYIAGAYAYILHHLAGVPLPEQFPTYKSVRFLNEIQTYNNDKMGLNIAILVAHVLLQLIEGKDIAVWDRISALSKYRERYLLDDPLVARSAIFIKLLVIMVKTGFQRGVFLEKAAPQMEALQRLPLQLTNQAYELELVPYEHLVQLLAKRLSRRGGGLQQAQPDLQRLGR
ncbi:MAG: hypothetical protein KGS48_09700 [Bacteroidetes bacterium]|nr:hypothetical protein [Bacteroidota bacterium]